MTKTVAQSLLYGGGAAMMAAAFGELATAPTWADVLTPAHVFGFLAALVTAAGALYHPSPSA